MASEYAVIKKTFHVAEPEDADRDRRSSAVPPRVRSADKGCHNDEATSTPKPPAALGKNRRTARPDDSSIGALSTVYMKNIPCLFDRERLCELLDSYGYSGSYDFLYLPMDFQSELSLGYAFVNFRDPRTAEVFRSVFDGFSSWTRVKCSSRKVLEVMWSRTQGFDSNVRNLSRATLPKNFAPLVFL